MPHPLEVLYKAQKLNRPKAFWETLGKCMTGKKMFYLSEDKAIDWIIFYPDHLIVIEMSGEEKKKEYNCTPTGFKAMLGAALIRYSKINPCGKTTDLENRIIKDASGLDKE